MVMFFDHLKVGPSYRFGEIIAFWALMSVLNADPAAAQATAGWQTYVDRAGTRVQVPANLFSVSAGPVKIGIGERFTTRDGRAALSIFTRSK
jgi:hypothetical protein